MGLNMKMYGTNFVQFLCKVCNTSV
jgi:hypothetical protein